jgi:hypothetical protein
MILTILMLAASPTPAAVAPRAERRTVVTTSRRAQRLRELSEVVRSLTDSPGGSKREAGPKGL